MSAAADAADALLDRLAGDGPIDAATALVVAHPDDETIAMAATMTRFTRLTLIHLTDGTSANGGGGDLGAIRRAELAAALVAARAAPVRRLAYGFTDGAVLGSLPRLVERLSADLAGLDAVITHPYEGGHIDHDTCAYAVHAACARLTAAGQAAPARVEFASYHDRRGKVRTGEFWPDPACREVRLELSPAAARRRAAAFECHASQDGNLRFFTLLRESFRTAPAYDFLARPPPDATLYDAGAFARFNGRIRAFRGLPAT